MALAATKSTVVAGSALVSLACGPGAPACAAALGSAAVVATNAAWDGLESLARNDTVGVVKTVGVIKDIAAQNTTVDAGQVFDIAFEQTALAAGGAFGGFKLGKANGISKVAKTPAKVAGAALKAQVKCLCKREAKEVPTSPLLLGAPSSITKLEFNTQSVDSMVHGVLSLFVILRLVFARSKSTLAMPYLAEICEVEGRSEDLAECHYWLLAAVQKLESLDGIPPLTDDQEPDPLLSSLSTLAFAFDNMVAENLVGSGLQLWLCSLFSMAQQEQCILKLRQGLREVQGLEVSDQKTGDHVRVKRATCCASRNFRKNHFQHHNINPIQRNAPGLKQNTRFLTPKQKVYAKVFDKVAKGKFDVVHHNGAVQFRVRLEGLRMVDEVMGEGGKVVKLPRSDPVMVHVSQAGQLVHLSGA